MTFLLYSEGPVASTFLVRHLKTKFRLGPIFEVRPGEVLRVATRRQHPCPIFLSVDSGLVQAAAGMGIYGPRTVYVIALKDAPGCHEFLLQDDGKWLHVKETTEIGEALPLVLYPPVL